MHVQVLGKTDEEMRVVVEGLNPQIANSLRRIMMNRVPILAIQTVDFVKNDSVLYDEIIAHRLGLLPLKFDAKAFNLKEDCDCEGKGCSECEIVFALDKKGPCMVYAKDLKSADKDVADVVYPDTPIVELAEGQSLKLQATASLDIGKNHAKHQASRVYFRFFPRAKVNKNISNLDEVVNSCPKNALSINGNKANVTVDCDLCKECVKTAKPEGSLEIVGDRNKFIFIIESISGLKPEEIFLKGIDILKSEAKEFRSQVLKLK